MRLRKKKGGLFDNQIYASIIDEINRIQRVNINVNSYLRDETDKEIDVTSTLIMINYFIVSTNNSCLFNQHLTL